MRILMMGDFSGRGQREPQELVARLRDQPLLAVDVDNLDAVLTRLAPSLQLAVGEQAGAQIHIDFRSLDDFHPVALYRHLPLFQYLRQLRARLLDPASFTQAAAELGMESTISQPPPAAQDRPSVPEDDAGLIERLLGRRPLSSPRDHAARPAEVDISRLIRTLVQPYIVPAPDSRQEQWVACVDQIVGGQLRALLHQPDFQALEAAWRSVHKLVTTLVTGEALQLYLLDVTRAELLADFRAAGGDVPASALYRLLVETEQDIAGGRPWSLLIGNYDFGTAAEDIALLTLLGTLGAQAGAPFLAEARCEMLGCTSLTDAADPVAWKPLEREAGQRWRTLRASPIVPWLGLALPRLLLRLPYGEKTDPVEGFDFEEMPSGPDRGALLWGNPACACALLLGQAFLDNGWSAPLDAYRELVDLPAYTYREADEIQLQPCAEVLLGERAATAILDRGIMPFLSYRRRNAVRLLRWQSLADPPTTLAGPWT